MQHTANITEIFSSLQGEGVYTGEPTIFVRFSQCGMKCAWCDTSHALCDQAMCRVTAPDGLAVHDVANPLSATALNEILEPYSARMLSVTGGEPLEQADFIAAWLPSVNHRHTILLETNGVQWEALKAVVPFVHIVSMDFKLPSSAGCRPMWAAHEAFLKTALSTGREVYVKIVVTDRTTDKDIQETIGIIAKINKFIPVIVQPASATLTFYDVISPQRLASIDRVVSAYLPNVSVAHQMHKEWGIQ